MTEKDNASMTTVQMKADYAASEVYSTASEPPPAYKRQSNSVKIAKITAFTIIVSSFILGAFILASSYLQAKASCDQVQALDSVLEKELMLETLQQVNKELPRAEALLGRENVNEDDLQSLDKEEPVKRVEHKMVKAEHKPTEEEATNMNENNEIDNSEETEEVQKYPGKIPLELDLSDLAAALLQNNKKSRMNCVVERKHAEEIVDSPSKTVALPFGMNLTTDPKKARITGERISIFCEGGNENKDQDSARHNNREEDEDEIEEVEAIRPMFIPFQRVPIPFGPIPNRFPLTHMPQRMEPMMPPRQQEQQHSFMRQMPPPPPPFQQLPMRPPMPPQEMQAPHPEPEQRIVRIQFHQIPIREMIHIANDVPQQISVQQHQQSAVGQQPQQAQAPHQIQIQHQPSQQQQQQQLQQQQQQQQQAPQPRQEFPFFQIQPMPLGLALERAGITAEDLNNIQRLTENHINKEFRLLTNESDEDESSNSSEDDEDNDDSESTAAAQQNNRQQQLQQQQQPQQQQNKPQMHDQQQAEQQQQQQQQQAERQARMQEIPMPIQRLILQPLPEQPRDTMTPPMPDQPLQRLAMGHPGWGRSLAQPVSIPVPMMESHNDMPARDEPAMAQPAEESERPHCEAIKTSWPLKKV